MFYTSNLFFKFNKNLVKMTSYISKIGLDKNFFITNFIQGDSFRGTFFKNKKQ